ncbi:hypothetical protein CHS0354_010624 [Potamilus streckersoni]|uniref:Bifunctional polynucleotide phosphatase/kinase n=1 Tax=Potamilus streckersoni TaxID=2493646 RepID=A0AAE0SGI2_9BIVA|nr:hypothetical protein CHS0354_010624 [Potamilus streckersoni]
MTRTSGLKRKAVADSERKAKRARGETDLSENLRWLHVGDLIKEVCPLITLTSTTLEGRSKVAGFDIDFTVIKTASGKKFATGASDWEWWNECVPTKLQKLHKDGYRVVFFTNQAGIEKMKVKPEEAFICTGNNHYRKPSTLMWEYFEEQCNNGVKVNHQNSLYVGDAAGRSKDWEPGKPKDFSCSDRMFALNLKIKFYTPEEFFLEKPPAKFKWGCVDPTTYLKKAPTPSATTYHSKTKEVIILVGPPASGKSTFRKRHLEPHGYVAINRDTLGTMSKCIKAAKDALSKGSSVVVDNTNPSADARSAFVKLGEEMGVACRCFWMATPIELAKHLNLVRQNQTNGEVRRIPDVAYNVYKKNYQEPSKSEGFSEIVKIDFCPKFDSQKDEVLFKQRTCAGH